MLKMMNSAQGAGRTVANFTGSNEARSCQGADDGFYSYENWLIISSLGDLQCYRMGPLILIPFSVMELHLKICFPSGNSPTDTAEGLKIVHKY